MSTHKSLLSQATQVQWPSDKFRSLYARVIFAIRVRMGYLGAWRKWWWRLQGMRIGRRVSLARIDTLWPNQVAIGDDCVVMRDVVFDYCHGVSRPGPSITIGDNTYVGRNIEFNVREGVAIGRDCILAAGCRFIDHDHGMDMKSLIQEQHGPELAITLGCDVWLGANVIVLKGVVIGDGVVVAAGAVVTRCIPAHEIWGGVPARKIGERS